MTMDALQVIHLAITGITALGALALGYTKMRNKQHGRDEVKFDKFVDDVAKKINDHVAADVVSHKNMEDNISKLCSANRKCSEDIAVLNERSQTEKELVNKLSDKLDEIRGLL